MTKIHKFSLIIVLLVPSIGISQISGMISPEMELMIKNMSPMEQREFAEQYGIDLSTMDKQPVETTLGLPGDPVKVNKKKSTKFYKDSETSKPDSSEEDTKLDRYGLSFFNQDISTFAPTDDSQVANDYILGVGDSLVVQLYGTENNKLELQIERDGSLVLPSLGSIVLAGLTFNDARKQILLKISQELIGVDAVITMGRIKAMNIFMAGEVNTPGKYSLSGLTTVTQALYQSGGISDIGSLRNIQVRRNGEIVKIFDAYDILINGDASDDIRLKSGDVILVPQYVGLAEIHGEVKRPMIYEITSDDTVADLLKMAGLFTDNAFPTQSTLIRNGLEGISSQVSSLNLYTENALKLSLVDGDQLFIMSKSDDLSNNIMVKGEATRAGNYGWFEGMRVSDIFSDTRKDLTKDADLNFSLIVREKNLKREISTHSFSLIDAINFPQTSLDPILNEFDELLIFSKQQVSTDKITDNQSQINSIDNENSGLKPRNVQNKYSDPDTEQSDYENPNNISKSYITSTLEVEQTNESIKNDADENIQNNSRENLLDDVIKSIREQSSNYKYLELVSISGGVNHPGIYPLFENATLNTLINAAGGLKDSAFLGAAEIRRLDFTENEIRTLFQEYSIDPTYSNKEDPKLTSRDHITVREISDWNSNKKVVIEGAVRFPGEYMISKGETIKTLVERAGGLLDEAFPNGSQFTRKSIAINEEIRAKDYAKQIRQIYSSRYLTEEKDITTFDEIQNVANVLENLSGNGRLVIDLPKILDGDESSNIQLQDGDLLYIPVNLNSVSIIGEVNRSSTVSHNPALNTTDYIRLAGGFTARADEESIYIIRANGAIDVLEKGFWSFGRNNPQYFAGDTIVVPIKASYKDGLSQWTEITQVIYQSMVSLAAVKGL